MSFNDDSNSLDGDTFKKNKLWEKMRLILTYPCSFFGVQMKYPYKARIEMIKFNETFIAYIYRLGID